MIGTGTLIINVGSFSYTLIFETCFGIIRRSCRGHLSLPIDWGKIFWRNGYKYRGTNPSVLSKNKYVKNVFEGLEMLFI